MTAADVNLLWSVAAIVLVFVSWFAGRSAGRRQRTRDRKPGRRS